MALKKRATKPTKNSSLPLIVVIGLVLGATFTVLITPYLNQEISVSTQSASKTTQEGPSVSKEEIINNILTVLKLNTTPFSKGYLSQVKAESIVRHPESALLKDEAFWKDFLTSKQQEIKKIDDEYIFIGSNFYSQFSQEELLEYYKLIKLPINTKILTVYTETLGDESFNEKEVKASIQDLVYKILPPGTENDDD